MGDLVFAGTMIMIVAIGAVVILGVIFGGKSE